MSAARESQEIPATQCTQTVDDELVEFAEDLSAVGEEDDSRRVWGRLLSRRGSEVFELCDRPGEGQGDEKPNQFNQYFIGRNRNLCDVAIAVDRRISGTHCRIFCQRASLGADPTDFHVFLENLSGNCTFINTSVKLEKHEQRRLNSGDEIALLFPKGKFPREVLEHTTFTFINVSERAPPTLAGSGSGSRLHGADGAAIESLVTTSPAARVPADSGALQPSLTAALGAERSVRSFYTFREELGRGQYGVVYRVINKQTGEHFACKQLDMRKAYLSGAEVESMMNEVRLLRDISHRGVISARDVFRDTNHLFFIMELVEGGDLFDRIVDKHKMGYPETLAREAMLGVMEAVEFLHRQGIVHRDLKPENILLVSRHSDTDIKLTDFGLAKRGETCRTFCGTPQYFAPEVLERQNTVRGEGRYGMEADMWSVGVILYVILSGSPPFGSKDLDEQVATATFAPLEGRRWADVSDAAKDLVRKLLVVAPEKRLTAQQALAHPWLCATPSVEGGGGSRTRGSKGGVKRRLEANRPGPPDGGNGGTKTRDSTTTTASASSSVKSAKRSSSGEDEKSET
eukprot:CAMPEP_0118968448 /NCGR_PEP_ID=MMETSP1173-20130426/5669_1 /TAXON_ID=1034831 /ORGANISM="Rhizochromulina marina cf, Strain CCMP1243" /LENGTH=571 /DNA_ID=CAMNT_0006917563 /DNA_START=117 /DNA_END=1832 /DNA_ORIENTATION=+